MSVTQIRGNTQIMDLTITDGQINAAAGIALSKLAEAVIQADGGQAFTGDQSLGGNLLTNLGTPVSASDAATKSYVDSVAQGLSFKEPVRVATTADGAMASAYANGQVVDGVTLATGDRILIKNQASNVDNGIYEVQAAGAPVRSADADGTPANEVQAGMYCLVAEGTVNGDSAWVLSTDNPITLGTTGLDFAQFSGAGQVVAGNGLSKSGNTLDVGAGDGIVVAADSIAVSVADFAGSNLEDDGSNNLRIAASAAGNGLTGGGADVLAVGAGNGITVSADAITVNDDSVGGANLASAINVTSNGVSVKIDDSSVNQNGLNQLQIKDAGVTSAHLNASVAGAGLAGGAGAPLSVNGGNGVELSGDDITLTLDGATLKLGAAGVALADLADGKILVGNGSSVATARTLTTREVPTGLINDSNVTFALANAPVNGSEMVFLNGLLQEEGAGNDYTIAGNTITMLDAPSTGSKLHVTSVG